MGADIYMMSPEYMEYDRYSTSMYEKTVNEEDHDTEEMRATLSKHMNRLHESGQYYRDSYNASSLLWVYGGSWWELCNTYGYEMKKDGIKALLELVKEPITIEMVERHFEQHGEFAEGGPDDWVSYFVKKREVFQKFLTAALENGYKLYCSV